MTTNDKEFESFEPSLQNPNENADVYKVYKRRWLILLIFVLYTISNLIQYIEFSIISDVITEYYQVPYSAVDWTSMVASVTYVIFSMPGSYTIDRIGIRKTFIIGIVGTCVGAWVKVGSVHPDRFWLIIVGQAIVSTFQICIFPLLPKIASTWFAYNQISTAIAVGCIGAQVGSSLAYIIPPFIAVKGEPAEVERGLYTLNLIYAVYTSILVPLIILFVTEAPPTPPSIAQQNIIKEKLIRTKGFIEACKSIFVKPYVLFLIIYSVNLGVMYPIQILSNEVILKLYPNSTYDVGVIGLLHTFLGMVGSMSTSMLLDKFKKHKITIWSVYFLFVALLALYMATLDQGIEFIYVTSVLTGISAGSIITSSMEMILEFTYPAPESVAAGFAYNCVQASSLIFTFSFGYIFRKIGIFYANLTLIIVMLTADLLFFFIPFDLKKKNIQDTENNKKELML